MKLKHCVVENFGSYKTLEIDFSKPGLTLVHGATGSGKSTLLDIPCWALYGITAKNGNVDEVRSWTSPDEPTKVVLEVEVNQCTLTITRIRGSQTQNDLFWEQDGVQYRGKDITDTQKRLTQQLGVSPDLYLTSAYFCEYSEPGQFFTSSAKDRRELLELIAPLEFASKIGIRAAEDRKEAKKLLNDTNLKVSSAQGRETTLKDTLEDTKRRSQVWENNRNAKLKTLEEQSESFEKDRGFKLAAIKTKIDAFTDNKLKTIEVKVKNLQSLQAKLNKAKQSSCPSCGNSKEPINDYLIKISKLESDIETLNSQQNPHKVELSNIQNSENYYPKMIRDLKAEKNPILAQYDKIQRDFEEAKHITSTLKDQVENLNHLYLSLSQLYDFSLQLRGELLRKAIKDIEQATNRYLETYFDSELRVGFSLPSSDSLEVTLYKNGYTCTYKQLSKGQRGLLKLSFSAAIMTAASNKAGVKFDNIFFDEALDGLDETLKIKAFRLFQELETKHNSVYIIEHNNEFKSLFTQKLYVTISEDISTIEEDNE